MCKLLSFLMGLSLEYLFGDFGVYKTEKAGCWRIDRMGTKGRIEDVTESGFPFFAGDIVFEREIMLDAQTDIEISLKRYLSCDAAVLYINEHCVGTRVWEPYSWHVNKDWVKEGYNKIKLQISNTLLGLFEGQRFDPIKHRYEDYE